MKLGLALIVGCAADVTHINPPLSPTKDEKFMGKDYPDDLRPGVHHFRRYDWDHPYPIVQDGASFEKDFVKDETGDNGYWEAQHKYDTLRSQIAQKKAKIEDYKNRIEAMGGNIDALEAKEAKLEADAKNAEARADGLKGDADGKNGRVAGIKSDEAKAAGMTQEEMDQLARCEAELKKVEDKLKELLKKAGTSISDAEKAELELKKAAMEAELKQMSEAELESKLAEEKAEWEAATKAYEAQLALVKQTEDAMNAAAEKLRQFREKEKAAASGVSLKAQKSSAVKAGAAGVMVAGAAILSTL
jgi:chromosome segregation ATPase